MCRMGGKFKSLSQRTKIFGFEKRNFPPSNVLLIFHSVLMKVNMSWTDRRIDFLHLRDDAFLNTVTASLRQKLWIPELGNLYSKFRNIG